MNYSAEDPRMHHLTLGNWMKEEVAITKELEADGITVQLRSYIWPAQFQTIRSRDKYFLSRSLLPSYPNVKACYSDKTKASDWVQVGRLVLSPVDIPMHVTNTGGAQRTVHVLFDPDKFETVTGLERNWGIAELQAGLDIGNSRLDEMMFSLAEEAALPGFASDILVEAAGNMILVELARHFRKSGGEAPNPGLGRVVKRARLAADYIDCNLSSFLSIAAVADQCGLSPSQLVRAFKEITGQTVHAYVERARFHKAKELLISSDLSIKQIAFLVGFPSVSNFSFSFRRRAGVTPTQYRQNAFGCSPHDC